MKSFETLNLPTALLENLNAQGLHTPTPIQEIAIPLIRQGRDLIAQAPTGSGKTLAFALPLLLKLKPQSQHPQALIIAPTRELSEQIATVLQQLSRHQPHVKILTLCGGTPLRPQVASLQQGATIVVGTAGRLRDHLSRGTLLLHQVHTLILDEGDRMLEMGFDQDILNIAQQLPTSHQSLLFSATYPPNIQHLAQTLLNNPKKITIEQTTSPLAIQEVAYQVPEKNNALLRLLSSYQPHRVLIFCTTKAETKKLTRWLERHDFDVAMLQGEMEQYQRQEMLLQFANGSRPIMVATDLAARGLDIPAIELVINYDLPDQPQTYTHRMGRTGRANAQGQVVTLCHPSELSLLQTIRPSLPIYPLQTLPPLKRDYQIKGEMRTLCIEGGKKQKLRAGDILGTLCQAMDMDPSTIGKIQIYDHYAYVAIQRSVASHALADIHRLRIKKRNFRIWWL